MLPIGLNHMTVPRASVGDLMDLADRIGAIGVELRNDLGNDPFGGLSAASVRDMALTLGLRILAVAEVSAFNDGQAERTENAKLLAQMAQGCGAQGIALIPKVASRSVDRTTQRHALKQALTQLRPLLEDHGVMGLIEPLGFENSSLRHKDDVVAVLDDIGRPACFAMIHDTFHHHLSGDAQFYPEVTALVHISGVTGAALEPSQMADHHRVLVNAEDRLGNVAQLRVLASGGYLGPASFEAFAPDVHDMTNPASALARSIEFITSEMAEVSA